MKNVLELLRFDGYQIFWSFLFIPVFTIDSINQLRRGWKILHKKEVSLHWVVKVRIWFIQNFIGQSQAEDFYANIFKEKTQSKIYGITAIIYGVFGIIFVIGTMIILVYSLTA
jgi:hypothetical protein